MAITKKADRQNVKLAWVMINLADLTTNVAAAAMVLPPNAVVLSGQLITTEAWNSTTSDVLDVGDSGLATRYLTDGNIRALAARVPLVPTGFISAGNDITVTWTSGGGTPTTGKVRLEVEYYIQGRADSTQD
jgi:hypothetical protein